MEWILMKTRFTLLEFYSIQADIKIILNFIFRHLSRWLNHMAHIIEKVDF